jgi:hypothetical protein
MRGGTPGQPFGRRLVAARYRLADAARSAWRDERTRPRVRAALAGLLTAACLEGSGLAVRLDGELRALTAALEPSSAEVEAVVVVLDGAEAARTREAVVARVEDGAPRAVLAMPLPGEPVEPLGLSATGPRFDRLSCEGLLAAGLRSLGLPCTRGALVRLAPPSDPTSVVAARAVLDGTVPPSTFEGAVVVVAPPAGPERIATPAGLLAPADALAQVLAARGAGRLAREAGGPTCVAGVLAVVAASLVVLRLPRARLRRAALLSLLLGVGSLALYLTSGLAFGPTAPVGAALAVALALSGWEERALSERLGGLVARLERVGAPPSDVGRYVAIARLAAPRFGASGSIVFGLADGRWHVEVKGSDGYAEAELLEARRDVRRDPFAEALRAGHVATPRLLAGTRETFLVPLSAGGQTLGFWAVGFRDGAGDLEAVRRLASEVASALLHAEAQESARGFVALEDRFAHLDGASGRLAARVGRDTGVFDGLPVPLLVAGPWAEVERCNGAMRALVAELGGDLEERGLVRLLSQLTGRAEPAIERLLSDAFAGRPATVPAAAGAPLFALGWSPGSDGVPGAYTLTTVRPDGAPRSPTAA